ncbi:hypothetical protein [Candidatus Villigracilis affinis]|uniref:hypothetical protein n=1 Tax=Candidatus Villigracilis affinis TaxID=3140682 RepID=UPI002A1E9B83|nr:hypothetical protein [Anaerolineales bacterium]
MFYDEVLADRIRKILLPIALEKRMFGGIALVDGMESCLSRIFDRPRERTALH